MHQISRYHNGHTVVGRSVPIFVPRYDGQFFLSNLEIYQDGRIFCREMDYVMPSSMKMNDLGMDLDELTWALAHGKIALSVPANSTVAINELATITISRINRMIADADFLRYVEDILLELNGQPTSSQRCLAAFLHFLEDPSEESQEHLRRAYEAVPNHWKESLLFDQNDGDAPITAIVLRNLADIHQDWLEELKRTDGYLREYIHGPA